MNNEITINGKKAIAIKRGRFFSTIDKIPKSWKNLGKVTHSWGSRYSPSWAQHYQDKQKNHILVMHRDGSFLPYKVPFKFKK
jgi:hypothetical protein